MNKLHYYIYIGMNKYFWKWYTSLYAIIGYYKYVASFFSHKYKAIQSKIQI